MNIVTIVLGTPYWVWIIFSYLFFSGIKALRPSTSHILILGITPLIFTIWSIYGIYSKGIYGTQLLFLIWLIAVIFGTYVGYHIVRRLKITVNPETKLVHLSGSYIPLILSMSFFF